MNYMPTWCICNEKWQYPNGHIRIKANTSQGQNNGHFYLGKVQRADLTCHVTSVRLRWFEFSRHLHSECTLKKQNIQILPEPDDDHVTRFFYKIMTLLIHIQEIRQRKTDNSARVTSRNKLERTLIQLH